MRSAKPRAKRPPPPGMNRYNKRAAAEWMDVPSCVPTILLPQKTINLMAIKKKSLSSSRASRRGFILNGLQGYRETRRRRRGGLGWWRIPCVLGGRELRRVGVSLVGCYLSCDGIAAYGTGGSCCMLQLCAAKLRRFGEEVK